MGVSPETFAQKIAPLGVAALGINCGKSLQDNLEALKQLAASTDLPIWFKPNAGLPVIGAEGNADYDISPEEMAADADQWVAHGARIIGGCCGTTPAHLKAIAQALASGPMQ